MMSTPTEAKGPTGSHGSTAGSIRLRAPWLRRLILLAIAAVVTVGIFRLLGRFDWPYVWDALMHLEWWHLLILLVVLVARQVCAAAPLTFYIPGVSLYRATANDLGAMTMAAFAPPRRRTWCCASPCSARGGATRRRPPPVP